MNKKILQKCIDELQKDKPDLSYLRGMLETLNETIYEPVPSGAAQWTKPPLDPYFAPVAPLVELTPAEQAVASAMDVLQSPIKPQH